MSSLLLVAICLGGGGVLTAIPFFLDYLSRQNLLHHQSGQMALNLTTGLERSQEVVRSLEKLREENNPLHLIADRLPGLVEEKLTEAIERQLVSQATINRQILEKIAQIESVMGDLPHRINAGQRTEAELIEEVRDLGQLIEELSERCRQGTPAVEVPVPAAEQISTDDLPVAAIETPELEEFETGEEIEAHSHSVLSGEDQQSANATEEEEDDDDDGLADPEPETDEAEPEEAIAEDLEEQVSETVQTVADEDQSPTKKPPSKPGKPRKSQLTISAFIGIQNKIYLRGKGPGLSQETGLLLPMTGIGEWEWEESLKETATVEIFLNDQTPSDLGQITLSPGEKILLHPTFTSKG